MVTTYIVGAEERHGTWRYYAVDRERFQRRLRAFEQVISPVLDTSHRRKLLDHYEQGINDKNGYTLARGPQLKKRIEAAE